MKRVIAFVIFILFTLNASICYSKNKRVASFPFEMIGNYVVIQAKINGSTPLNLILDSGLESTVITELYEDDELFLNLADTVPLQGLGNGSDLNALFSNDNTLKIKKLQIKNVKIYLLPKDAINFSMILGRKVNGIMGWDIFKHYVVEINYTSQKVTIYDPESYQAPDKYEYLPMETFLNKMFIYANIKEENTENYKRVKVLLDTGAETSAWFHTIRDNHVKIPEKRVYGVIGEGWNGEILGNFSRLPELCIGSYCIANPIVAFPDSIYIANAARFVGRDGSVGSQILKRFNMIIDYQNKRFYFNKNRFFNAPFEYNIAGVELIQTTLFFPMFEINKIWRNSKAEKAGIKKGDIIFEINGEKVYFKTLPEVRKIFSTPSKRPLKLLIKRDDEFLTIKLDMKDEL